MLTRLEKIKKFIKNENDIKGVLNTMCNIEKNEGQNSLKINSLNGLLKDFLIDEEKIMADFNNDQSFLINYLNRNSLTLIDELEASFLDDNSLIQYRLFKLDSTLNTEDLIKTETYLELIKTSEIDLKYKLCFVSPILMDLLVKNNFNCETINLDEYKDKNYEVKKISFLFKKCSEFIIFMIENEKADDCICLNYLKVLKNSINQENFNIICTILAKSGYEFNKIEKINQILNEKVNKKLD